MATEVGEGMENLRESVISFEGYSVTSLCKNGLERKRYIKVSFRILPFMITYSNHNQSRLCGKMVSSRNFLMPACHFMNISCNLNQSRPCGKMDDKRETKVSVKDIEREIQTRNNGNRYMSISDKSFMAKILNAPHKNTDESETMDCTRNKSKQSAEQIQLFYAMKNGKNYPSKGNNDAMICKMCIKQNEVKYYCKTCEMKICNYCHYFHDVTCHMMNHEILSLA